MFSENQCDGSERRSGGHEEAKDFNQSEASGRQDGILGEENESGDFERWYRIPDHEEAIGQHQSEHSEDEKAALEGDEDKGVR